jgi:hypothetical protein
MTLDKKGLGELTSATVFNRVFFVRHSRQPLDTRQKKSTSRRQMTATETSLSVTVTLDKEWTLTSATVTLYKGSLFVECLLY